MFKLMTGLSLLLNESDLLVTTHWQKHAGSFKDFWLNDSRTLPCAEQGLKTDPEKGGKA